LILFAERKANFMIWLFSAGLAIFIFAGILYFSAVIPATRKP